MSNLQISSHTNFSSMSKAYLRYRAALRFSAAMQAAYTANHPDPAAHERPIHERELIQLAELQIMREGLHLNMLV